MNVGADFAPAYAAQLLHDAGMDCAVLEHDAQHPALAWAASGCMNVTGYADGPALMCPAPLAGVADGALLALAAMAAPGAFSGWRGATLLGQRARLMNLRRAGAISAGGMCRLLPCQDGWIAVSLVRTEDWQCVPAWLEAPGCENWQSITTILRGAGVEDMVSRARLLGLAAARADISPSRRRPSSRWFSRATPPHNGRRKSKQPLVLDFSSLWAGPLCGALLLRAGARVIKVESPARPDGARSGHGGFYDFLNAGKESLALDWRGGRGAADLRRLLRRADIVITASRPRALRQTGIDADEIVAENPGITLLSITGHGGEEPEGNWIGFGDDAAAAGGLCDGMRAAHGGMVFCGDAIADPLTGLHAAVATWAAWRNGGGHIGVSLRGVAAHCAAMAGPDPAKQAREWAALATRQSPNLLPLPVASGSARKLGADNAALASEFAVPC